MSIVTKNNNFKNFLSKKRHSRISKARKEKSQHPFRRLLFLVLLFFVSLFSVSHIIQSKNILQMIEQINNFITTFVILDIQKKELNLISHTTFVSQLTIDGWNPKYYKELQYCLPKTNGTILEATHLLIREKANVMS